MDWGEFAVSVLTLGSGCTSTIVRDASICIFVLPSGFVETEAGTRTVCAAVVLVDEVVSGALWRFLFDSVTRSDLGKRRKRAAGGGGAGEAVGSTVSVFDVVTGGRVRGVQSISSIAPSTKSSDLTEFPRFTSTSPFG